MTEIKLLGYITTSFIFTSVGITRGQGIIRFVVVVVVVARLVVFFVDFELVCVATFSDLPNF